MVVVALLLVGIMTTSVLASSMGLGKNTNVSADAVMNADSAKAIEAAPIKVQTQDTSAQVEGTEELAAPEVNVEDLKRSVPDAYAVAEAAVSVNRVRFLLYTADGSHIMWGYVGNGYFVGEDNLGKRCWGIYGNGVFAGFYDGDFFWGKYNGGNWKAMGLFGLNYAYGEYVLFPLPTIQPTADSILP